jgi:hypothetical protein
VALYNTDFSTYSTGASPPDWDIEVGGWEVVPDSTAPGTQSMRVITDTGRAGGGGVAAHLMERIVVDSTVVTGVDMDVTVRFNSPNRSNVGIVMRGGTTAPYYLYTDNSLGLNNIFLWKGTSTGGSNPVTGGSWAEGTIIDEGSLRFRLTDNVIQWKHWKGGPSAEPTDWEQTFTDTSSSAPFASGTVGVFAGNANTSTGTITDFHTFQVNAASSPDKPILETDDIGQTWWRVVSQAYNDPEGAAITQTEFQFSTSTGFASPFSTQLFGDSTSNPISLAAQETGLVPASTYYSRVRHRGADWSTWSDEISAVTDPSTRPDKPSVVTLTAVFDGFSMVGSAYNHPSGLDGSGEFLVPHTFSDFLVAAVGDTSFNSPLVTSTQNSRDLTTWQTGGVLDPSETYRFKFRYIGEDGIESTYSDDYLVNTPALSTDVPGTPTVSISTVGVTHAVLASSTFTHASTGHSHDATWWLITTSTVISSVVVEEISTSDLLSWSSTNVGAIDSASTFYAWARHRDDLSEWGGWGGPTSLATLSPPGHASFSAPLGPTATPASTGFALAATVDGGLSTGFTAHFQYRPTNSTAGWVTIQNTSVTTATWDLSTFASGFYDIRVLTDSTGSTPQDISDYNVVIVTTGTAINKAAEDITKGVDLEDQGFLEQWDHLNVGASNGWTAFYADGGILSVYTGGGGSAVMSLREVDSPVTIRMATRFLIAGFEGGIIGDAGSMWDTELNYGGAGLMTSGRKNVSGETDQIPLLGWAAAAGMFPVNSLGPCGERGLGDAFIVERVNRTLNEGGNKNYSTPIGTMTALNRRCHGSGNLWPLPYYLLLAEFTPTTINADNTFSGTMRTKVVGPYQEPTDWQTEQFLTDLTFGCGKCGYWHHVPAQFWGQPFMIFRGMAIGVDQQLECVTEGCPPDEITVAVSNISGGGATFTGPQL